MFKKLMERKSLVTSLLSAFMFAVIAGGASANTGDLEAVQTSITESMSTIQNIALTALGSVAAVAILLFGGIYAWRYGKKVFNVVSR